MSEFCEQIIAAHDLENPPPDLTARVSREEAEAFIRFFNAKRPPPFPTTAVAWDLIRTFGEDDGKALLTLATSLWDEPAKDWSILGLPQIQSASPQLTPEQIDSLWFDDDHEPEAWQDIVLVEEIEKWRQQYTFKPAVAPPNLPEFVSTLSPDELKRRVAEAEAEAEEAAIEKRLTDASGDDATDEEYEAAYARYTIECEAWKEQYGKRLWPDIYNRDSRERRKEQEMLRDAALAEWSTFGPSPTPQTIEAWKTKYRKLAIPFERMPPVPSGYVNTSGASGLPMLNTQAVVADLGRPIVETFLAGQSGRPATNAPTLPDVISKHPLFESLNTAIAHVVGLAEHAPKIFRAGAVVDMLAVLSAAHEPTFDAVCTRIRAAGAALPDSRLSAAVRRFEAQVAREVRTGAGWATDAKGMPDSSNTDNTAIFARMMGVELRQNTWSRRAEIRWAADGEWAPLQEKDFNYLLTTAANGQYNFRPRESMFKRALSALAHETTYDPVLARLAAAQAAWDGTPRLDSWLARACGLPDDAYHSVVGRSLLGGICKRARRPGCKHDDVVILIGPQDTLKSTLCRVLALDDEWFTDSVAFEGSPQNIVPQLFGKLVVELAELDGMARREVNYIKRFLSAQSDNVTLKYEAFASDHARRCIFIGTSNELNPLRDATGNRRFLPVRIEGPIDVEWVRTHREQLIGEAATLEAAGELFLIPHEVLPEARARQEDARAESDFEIHLHAWFAGKPGASYITPSDLAILIREATGRSVPANQYGLTMRKLGFFQSTPRVGGSPMRVWCRGGMDGAHRWTVHRGMDGRAYPKLPMLPPPPPMPGGTAVVLPMVRPQQQ